MFETTHNIDFEAAKWYVPDFQLFRIGTCEGLWAVNKREYIIVAVINNSPGNGHLNDVFKWFEHSCVRDKKSLVVAEIMNQRFYDHLLNKRGFKNFGGNKLKKEF